MRRAAAFKGSNSNNNTTNSVGAVKACEFSLSQQISALAGVSRERLQILGNQNK